MPHVRRQLREAAAALVTGLGTTGTRVFQSRMRPQSDTALPCLLVATNDEAISPASIDDHYERSLTLSIKGIAKASASLDDTLDQIALEVETALAGDPDFGNLAAGLQLRGIQIDFDDTTDKPVGVITLDYAITYFTAAGSPGSIV